jgi:hypothetical protein
MIRHAKAPAKGSFGVKSHSLMSLGAKAVDIITIDTNTLRYCRVTNKTLTISHVWSHGQGGRPEEVQPEGTGFSLCLHHRHADLANSFGCESY